MRFTHFFLIKSAVFTDNASEYGFLTFQPLLAVKLLVFTASPTLVILSSLGLGKRKHSEARLPQTPTACSEVQQFLTSKYFLICCLWSFPRLLKRLFFENFVFSTVMKSPVEYWFFSKNFHMCTSNHSTSCFPFTVSLHSSAVSLQRYRNREIWIASKSEFFSFGHCYLHCKEYLMLN